MKRFISLLLTMVMISTMVTVAITTVNAKTTSTVNGKSVSIGDKVTVTYYVCSDDSWVDFQGYVTYDSTGLQINNFTMPNTKAGVMNNTGEEGIVYYCGSNFVGKYDFTTEKVFYTAEFTVIGEGNYSIENTWEIIDDSNFTLIVGDGIYDSSRLSCRLETTVTAPKAAAFADSMR